MPARGEGFTRSKNSEPTYQQRLEIFEGLPIDVVRTRIFSDRNFQVVKARERAELLIQRRRGVA